MRLLDLPIRLLLVATFGLLPLLCCCGSVGAAQAVEAEPVAAEHSCCATGEGKPAETPEHECDCGTYVAAMERQAEVTPATLPASELPLLPPMPLPELIASAFADVDVIARPPTVSEAAAVPAAPTLRSLSVLLLT